MPNLMNSYNKHMGDVDPHDWLVGSIKIRVKERHPVNNFTLPRVLTNRRAASSRGVYHDKEDMDAGVLPHTHRAHFAIDQPAFFPLEERDSGHFIIVSGIYPSENIHDVIYKGRWSSKMSQFRICLCVVCD
ncbi:hypothetical protein TNCV_4671751 [Trichonephila clavipes]|nr:hypothetical protein TNCV_4671751 [Trichonephila clavipes]